jgi:hypothetical protein
VIEIKIYKNYETQYHIIQDKAKEEQFTYNDKEEKCMVLNYLNTWWLFEQNYCRPLSKNYWMFHDFT